MSSSRKKKRDASVVGGRTSEEREPVRDRASEKREPVGRCRAFSFVHNDHFYVCQGQVTRHDGYSEEQLLPLQRYDFTLAQWKGISLVSLNHEPEEKKFTREFMVDDVLDGDVCCAWTWTTG